MLPLLPPSGLDLSVLVAVLAGTLVLAWLAEAFGWSFGGLVVPGYLASLFIVSPAVGATIVAEASLSLGVLGLTDLFARTGVWTRFFGRERFLLLVLISILVRQSSEIWLWPMLLTRQEAWFGARLLQAGEAHSVGLVLVPLTANALGRGRFWTGLRQLVLPTVLAWGVLRYGLLAGTNVSFSAMALTYEDVSLDFLQSARAYFVLATGALAATLLNGALAWSAGGVLIPALLGLAWYEPARIAATFVEALVLATAFRALVRLPVVRDQNLEGPRKLAVLFVLSAVYRVGTAWVHQAGIPVRTEELSGLGYLLSALVALKILQFGSAPTVLIPAVGTSLVAFLGGSSAAWALEQVLPAEPRAVEAADVPVSARLLATPEGVVAWARVRARLDPERAPSIHLPAARIAAWSDLWERLAVEDPSAVDAPAGGWVRLEPGTGEMGGRAWWLVRETSEILDTVEGWGTGIVRAGASGPALLVERPWRDPDAARAAVGRCLAVDCRVLFVSGMDLPTGTDDARDALSRVLRFERVTGAAPSAGATLPDARRTLDEALTAVLAAPAPAWHASPTELEYLASVLVPAADGWSDGAVAADDLVAAARVVGYDVEALRACEGCVLLASAGGGPALAVRTGAPRVALVASHPRREAGTLTLARGAFDALGARALTVDPRRDDAPVPPERDAMQALHLGWRRRGEDAGADAVASRGSETRGAAAGVATAGERALWFRGLGPGTPDSPAPEVDVVVGAGRPVFAAPPTALGDLVADGRLLGVWSARWAAAGRDEAGLAGNHLAGPRASVELGGMPSAVLWFSAEARARWRSEDRAATEAWFAAAGLALRDASVGEPLEAGEGRAALAGLVALARDAAHQRNLNLVRRLVEEAGPDVTVRAAWDPNRGLARIDVTARTPDGPRGVRAWVVAGDDRVVTLPPDAPAARVRAAVGWAPADVVFAPERP